MVTFVNRQDEMKLIDEAFKALQNYENDSLLRTPIIDFFGVEGIVKTAVLEYIEERCKKRQIRYIFIDTTENASHFSHEIIRQVTERYNIRLHSLDENEDLLQQSLHATKALLEQGTAVMLLDNVDATNDELLERIAVTLRDVINDKKLFVVLASKRDLLFDFERSVSRKLTSRQLKPLDRKSCEHYLDLIDPPLTPEMRKCILDWTRGYPLAIEVMTITEHKLDPAQPEDQKTLVDLIVERVLDQKVFARLAPSEQSKYKEALTILSLPKRFNLVIMQELTEHFAPDLKRGNSPASMKTPGSIKNDTDVLRKASYISDGTSADVLLVTTTDVEAKAIFDLFPNRSQRVIDGRIYYDLGLVGTAKTFMAQSTGAGPAHARICIEEGIQALSPLVIIMVGIAFGLHPAKQQTGDILVSQQIEDYDQQKIGTGPNGQRKIYARGERVRASERLLNRFIAGRHEWQTPPDVHFGLILSGSRLVSHKGFRDELLRTAPEAIGGEMEGASLYEVANRKHVEWVLVKAICDWADASKNDVDQMLAAKNAARFVIQVVGQDQFVRQR